MTREMPWRKAIEKVLSEASEAVHYKEITDKIIEDGLRTSLGATPAMTVSANLTTAVKNEAQDCPFQKVGKGLYIWKEKAGITQQPEISAAEQEGEEAEEQQYGVVSSFGMFWRREAIEWNSTPKTLGMQQIGAAPVDFSRQIGFICSMTAGRLSMLAALRNGHWERGYTSTLLTVFHLAGIDSHGLASCLFQKLGLLARFKRHSSPPRWCQL
jgi:hypothetical protein